jgi:hypothetical protein
MGQYYLGVVSEAGSRDEFATGIVGYAHAHRLDNGLKLMEHSYLGNAVPGAVEARLAQSPARVVWAGDYADEEPDGTTLYFIADQSPLLDGAPVKYRYLCNLDKGLHVDLDGIEEEDYGFRINPLPLLCSEGNGRGGGDYHGTSMELVGSWARDLIAVSDTEPENSELLVPGFHEGR